MPEETQSVSEHPLLTHWGRLSLLAAAFLGWFFGGMQILLTNLGMRAAALHLMGQSGMLDYTAYVDLNSRASELSGADLDQLTAWNTLASQWYAWFQCAFLFGAAAGGFLFGKMGDHLGRTRALGISILWFGGFTGLAWFAQTPHQLLILRFLACLGIGGTWPNGVALVAEVWSQKARPALASAIGMAGNLGIFAMSSIAANWAVTPESWRWVMLINASPVLLGILIWGWLPESPAWKEGRASMDPSLSRPPSIFRGTLLKCTLVGIGLATVPLIGGWGSANWMMPWADEVGSQTGQNHLKAHIGMARSVTSIVGSLFAGILAVWIGRRRMYFLTSFGALVAAQYAFWLTTPGDPGFLVGVAMLGLFNGFYFGWLPFFLPELFPTRVRSTGAGVSFNFGRILTAFTIVATGVLIGAFDGDYAKIGRLTSTVFLIGMVIVLFAPDTSKRQMSA